ncbi:MAG: PAS domain S-box protein, partial [Flavisolibacter sp.]
PKLHVVKIVKKSGEQRWVERGAIPIELGEKSSVLITQRDITEHKEAEEAVRKSEKRYRALLENASDAILLADESGNLIEASRMAEVLLGYPREELLQMHYTELHPMTELERTLAAFKDVVTYGHGTLNNGAILRKDGVVVPVDITATVIEHDGGKVIQASFRDVSEHRRTKDTLETLIAELNAALKVLLKQREEDRTELEEKVISNVKHLLSPHLEKLKKRKFDPKSKMHLDILESNLHNIVSSFSHKLSSKHINLTPTEIKVANLVREGKTTKEIAEFLGSSPSSIKIHRFNVRKKLGLIGKKTNLQSYLTSLS